MNGCLTGLVAITAGCATVETWAAVVIGSFAGFFYLVASRLLVRLRIDDAVDAIPVHMVGGAWGVLATGLFSKPELMETAFGLGEHPGLFYGGGGRLLGIQLIAILFIMAWTGTTMGIFYYVLNFFGLFRISRLEEEVGMDISRHKGACYNHDTEGSDRHQERIHELNQSRSKRNFLKNLEGDASKEMDATVDGKNGKVASLEQEEVAEQEAEA